MSPPRVLRRARWTNLYHPGTDRVALTATDDGFQLTGSARIRYAEGPRWLKYAVASDLAWNPRSVRIDLRRGKQRRLLRIEVSEDLRWEVNGFLRPELRGYTDVDLAASPSTNTLTLRRLDLPIRGVAEIKTVSITFPDLDVRPVRQRYTRMSEGHYRYEGLHNGFVAEFDVDELGLVVHFPGFWERAPLARRRRPAPEKSSRRRA